MFLFSVVIDHANNPMASTGKFECIYHQTMTRPRLSHANRLEVIGFGLRPKYDNTKETGPEVISCNFSEINGQSHILLNTFNKLDYIQELYLDDNCLHRTHNDDIETGASLNANLNLNTKNNMAEIKLHAITKPDYGDVNSDVGTNSYLAKIEFCTSAKCKSYNDCLDTKSDVKATLDLDALTQSDSNDYSDKLNLETNRHIGSIKVGAITRHYYGDCLMLIQMWRRAII